MRISLGSRALEFTEVRLSFQDCRARDVFALKNNKTVAETLRHPRYAHLANDLLVNHPDCLQRRLGEFLYELKMNGQSLYKRFLNPYGDDAYCRFSIGDPSISKQKGLYSFVVNE